ncbi:MAG: hypothetical protein OXF67_07955 [Cyanobacteria bacterium MAG CAR4_bin_6]|nr:hypothetical protein [Cyanobacteria bacterium MAG CAR4_bin_6]
MPNARAPMMPRITLQNTPHRKGAIARSVRFNSHGNSLQGTLHLPETGATSLPEAPGLR